MVRVFHLVAFNFNQVLGNYLPHLFLCLKKAVAHGPQSQQALGFLRREYIQDKLLPHVILTVAVRQVDAGTLARLEEG